MKILYVDMDNVLVNFQSGIEKLSNDDFNKYKGKYDQAPNIFSMMDPLEGAIEAYEKLSLKTLSLIVSFSFNISDVQFFLILSKSILSI